MNHLCTFYQSLPMKEVFLLFFPTAVCSIPGWIPLPSHEVYHHFPMVYHHFPMVNHHFPMVYHHDPMVNHHFPVVNPITKPSLLYKTHHFPMAQPSARSWVLPMWWWRIFPVPPSSSGSGNMLRRKVQEFQGGAWNMWECPSGTYI